MLLFFLNLLATTLYVITQVLVDTIGPWDMLRRTQLLCWQRQTCLCEVILSSDVGEKLQRELHLCLEIFKFRVCLLNILQLHGALYHRAKALDPVEARPWTLCIGSKFHGCNNCIDLLP